MADDLIYAVKCAKCGKIKYTLKSVPALKGWKFVNNRLVCSKCVNRKSQK